MKSLTIGRLQKIVILLYLLLSGNSFLAQKTPYTFQGKIVGITDGDTFKVLTNKQQITIRLAHIDCPEKKQPFGNNAKKRASDLCFGKLVEVKCTGEKDRYQRIIAEIFVNGQNINKKLVEEGLAWHFKKYSKNKEYAALEVKAKIQKKGLWIDKNAVSPSDWRKTRKQNKSNL